jgi:hypothetical protein
MNIGFLYAGALASLAIAAILIRNTSPFADCGGTRYEWLRRRRLAGKLFFVHRGPLPGGCGLAGQLINNLRG